MDEELGDKIGQAIALRNISDIFIARGDYHSTSEYFQKAYDAFLETGFKLGRAYIMASKAV